VDECQPLGGGGVTEGAFSGEKGPARWRLADFMLKWKVAPGTYCSSRHRTLVS